MRTFKAVLITIIIALLIAFALINTHSVDIKLTAERVLFSSQLWAVVYVSFVLGVIFGLLLRWRKKPKKAITSSNTTNPAR
jgi:uncharacterized integral membrane protein